MGKEACRRPQEGMRVRWRLPRHKRKNNVISAIPRKEIPATCILNARPGTQHQGPRTQTHNCPYTYQITVNPVPSTVSCH